MKSALKGRSPTDLAHRHLRMFGGMVTRTAPPIQGGQLHVAFSPGLAPWAILPGPFRAGPVMGTTATEQCSTISN